MKNAGNIAGRKNKTGLLRDMKKNKSLYFLAIPIIAYFFAFNYLPMFGLVIAFENFKPVLGVLKSTWVGLENFKTFFGGASFLAILRNTLVINGLGLFIGFPLSIIFALLIDEIKLTKFKKTVQTISYLPYFVSMVVIAGLIIDFCSNNGIITEMFVRLLHVKRENLLQNPNYFWVINLLSDIWQGLGYGSIIFIAAITNVSAELHEAATIDGAGRLRRAWNITIPSIMPTIVMMLVLRCGLMMQVGGEKILLLYNPSIYATSDVIATHVQRLGIEKMQYGYSAAVGLFNSVVGTILLLASNGISKKMTDSSVI